MEPCVCCGKETSHTATVFLTPAGASPVQRSKPLCSDCVKKSSTGFSPVVFYLVLQLCWFTVLKNGLFTPFGILAACIASAGLWRLVRLALHRFSHRSSRPYNPEDASEALKQILTKQTDGPILSIREYRRKYGQDLP